MMNSKFWNSREVPLFPRHDLQQKYRHATTSKEHEPWTTPKTTIKAIKREYLF
jgi:hypothetical protein